MSSKTKLNFTKLYALFLLMRIKNWELLTKYQGVRSVKLGF